MKDPRSENARAFATDSANRVTGVKLTVKPAPSTKWELVRASLVDENAAQGNIVATVQVIDKDGISASVNCYLAWPWENWQFPNGFENKLLPGAPSIPYQHMITNTYNPASKSGPLAIYIGDGHGNVQSDVIGGLGLPGGRHVCYHLIFRERTEGGETDPTAGGGEETTTAVSGDLAAQLQRIEDKLNRLSAHFGVQ